MLETDLSQSYNSWNCFHQLTKYPLHSLPYSDPRRIVSLVRFSARIPRETWRERGKVHSKYVKCVKLFLYTQPTSSMRNCSNLHLKLLLFLQCKFVKNILAMKEAYTMVNANLYFIMKIFRILLSQKCFLEVVLFMANSNWFNDIHLIAITLSKKRAKSKKPNRN